MNVISHPAEFGPGRRPVCLAIGFFDGVHLGHQQVIRQAIADAAQCEGTALLITFDRHPAAVVAPDRVPLLIYSLPRKLRAIESLGIETTLLYRFDAALSRVSASEFIHNLTRELGPIASVCVGANFVFGYNRTGDVAFLKDLGAQLNFKVHGLAALALDGQTISSTRIRNSIREGNLDAAGQMLGRPYTLSGPIVQGDQLGRRLGFPTANLAVPGLVLPPSGVYAVHAALGRGSYKAVLNIGHRPTLRSPQPELRVEAHLLGFSGDLYGQEIELTPVAKLRPEKQFTSTDELRAQIERDIQSAAEAFGK